MSVFDVVPADTARFDDLQRVLNGGGDGPSCQCQWPLLPSAESRGTTVEGKRAMLRDQVAATPPPGLLAYDGAEPVGWVRVGPRPSMRRIAASRIVRGGSSHAVGDDDVWAVTCFSVRREHRGRGVVRALLAGAVDHARAGGARVLEAYPFDLAVRSRTSNDLYVGALSAFEDAGFRVVARPTESRAVVELVIG